MKCLAITVVLSLSASAKYITPETAPLVPQYSKPKPKAPVHQENYTRSYLEVLFKTALALDKAYSQRIAPTVLAALMSSYKTKREVIEFAVNNQNIRDLLDQFYLNNYEALDLARKIKRKRPLYDRDFDVLEQILNYLTEYGDRPLEKLFDAIIERSESCLLIERNNLLQRKKTIYRK